MFLPITQEWLDQVLIDVPLLKARNLTQKMRYSTLLAGGEGETLEPDAPSFRDWAHKLELWSIMGRCTNFNISQVSQGT